MFKASEETKKMDLVKGDSSKQVTIGSGLDEKKESTLIKFLRKNGDIFAWSSADMPGVPRKLGKHSLNVFKGAKAVKQTTRRFGEKKRRVIGAEIVKLQEAKFIREVVHTEWLANPVLVPNQIKSYGCVSIIPS